MNYLKLQNGDYLYNVDKNSIINAESRDVLEKYPDVGKVEIVRSVLTEEDLKGRVANVEQISLEMTQNCDLNCRYCVYGGAYKYQRPPAENIMSWDTARQTIDFFHQLTGKRENKRMALSFYGGEPFLNFDLIRKSVNYAKERFDGWDLHLLVTSNMTVMNDEIIDFIVKNKFKLSVSLDGPKEIHDKNRVFHDGSGSYDLITKNLGKIRQKSEEFYRNISFFAVFSNDTDIKEVHRFFTGDRMVRQNSCRLNPVSVYDTDYYEQYHYDREALLQEFAAITKSIEQKKLQKKEVLPMEQSLFNRYAILDELLKVESFTTLAGTCLFDHKVYVDYSGRFHVCEKINNLFPFGDVWKGYDFGKMADMANQFSRIVEERCLDCPYNLLCGRCFVNFAKEGKFEFDEELCANRKMGIQKNLEAYLKFKAEGIL
jgi:uncharacterized protein